MRSCDAGLPCSTESLGPREGVRKGREEITEDRRGGATASVSSGVRIHLPASALSLSHFLHPSLPPPKSGPKGPPALQRLRRPGLALSCMLLFDRDFGSRLWSPRVHRSGPLSKTCLLPSAQDAARVVIFRRPPSFPQALSFRGFIRSGASLHSSEPLDSELCMPLQLPLVTTPRPPLSPRSLGGWRDLSLQGAGLRRSHAKAVGFTSSE